MLPRFDTHYIAMFTLLHLKLPAAFLGSFVVQSFNLFYQSHFEDWSLMANPEAHETDHRRRKVFELKKELQRLLKTILDEDDYGMQVTDEALRVLSCLKEFHLKKSHSSSADCLDVPEVFRSYFWRFCGLTLLLWLMARLLIALGSRSG
ncbi:uncharacterized protein LOC116144263 [Pistacia vera]|uniref:uncharacterized protein LOC116144263 n=1 Tax=Pistacia vera TaxID=55513 RepID=UPI0012639478|nr:uncharacterized protein LOC116144263 [Pistacia vera]